MNDKLFTYNFKDFLKDTAKVITNVLPYYLRHVKSALVFNKKDFGSTIGFTITGKNGKLRV